MKYKKLVATLLAGAIATATQARAGAPLSPKEIEAYCTRDGFRFAGVAFSRDDGVPEKTTEREVLKGLDEQAQRAGLDHASEDSKEMYKTLVQEVYNRPDLTPIQWRDKAKAACLWALSGSEEAK